MSLQGVFVSLMKPLALSLQREKPFFGVGEALRLGMGEALRLGMVLPIGCLAVLFGGMV